MSEALPGMIFNEVKGSMTSEDGQTAFFTTGFEIGKGPKGEPVLIMMMGDNAKMNFVLSQEMLAPW
jgi:hypothetical protein